MISQSHTQNTISFAFCEEIAASQTFNSWTKFQIDSGLTPDLIAGDIYVCHQVLERAAQVLQEAMWSTLYFMVHFQRLLQ